MDIPFLIFSLYTAIALTIGLIGIIMGIKKISGSPFITVIAGFMFLLQVIMIENIELEYVTSETRTVDLQELYHLHTWNADRDLFGAGNTIRAMHATAGSSLISEDFFDRVDCMQLFIKKTGAPTGTATIGSFDGSQVLIFTFGTIDVSTLTTSYVLYNFCPAVELHHFIDTDSYMGIRYTGGDATNKIFVAVNTNNPIGDNILVSRFAGADWVDEPNVDLSGVLYNRAETKEIITSPVLHAFNQYDTWVFTILLGLVFIFIGVMLQYAKW